MKETNGVTHKVSSGMEAIVVKTEGKHEVKFSLTRPCRFKTRELAYDPAAWAGTETKGVSSESPLHILLLDSTNLRHLRDNQ